jgi:hypothetical protein
MDLQARSVLTWAKIRRSMRPPNGRLPKVVGSRSAPLCFESALANHYLIRTGFRQTAAREGMFYARHQWLRCARGRFRPMAHGRWLLPFYREYGCAAVWRGSRRTTRNFAGRLFAFRHSTLVPAFVLPGVLSVIPGLTGNLPNPRLQKRSPVRCIATYAPSCEMGYGAFECVQRRFYYRDIGSHEKSKEDSADREGPVGGGKKVLRAAEGRRLHAGFGGLARCREGA